ncbi:MAG: hypothetical protein F4Z31_04565 [Gemmatimonadetes bacterium]|nr:hypothetical protein [Gemmatimonadota bacterium]MYJ12431.1 hypothetical protein [Gemmatimonadota bacterium]
MAEGWWSFRWKNGDAHFTTVGPRNDRMPVYAEVGTKLRLTQMTFPACLKFMPYAEDIENWKRVSRKNIQARIIE